MKRAEASTNHRATTSQGPKKSGMVRASANQIAPGLKHPNKPEARVVLPMHSREIIFVKTLASILEPAELTADELIELL